MNTTDVLALELGPALDEAVHRHVFGGTGPVLFYSADPAAGAAILEKLPLFVARLEKPKDPLKPWMAGTLGASLDGSHHTTLTVSGATMLGVLCRAALLVAIAAPAPAAGPNTVRVPEKLPETPPVPQPAGRPSTRRAKVAPVGTKTPPAAPMPAKAPQKPVPAIRQPSIFLSARAKLPPIPKRKAFVMPGDPAK